MIENYPPHVIYTDENMKRLSFEQINEEFNKMLEYALGTSLCPKCGYVSWLTGDKGACLEQGRPETTNPIVIKYWSFYDKFNDKDKIMEVIQSLGMLQLEADEKAMKLLLKNPDVIEIIFIGNVEHVRLNFYQKLCGKY